MAEGSELLESSIRSRQIVYEFRGPPGGRTPSIPLGDQSFRHVVNSVSGPAGPDSIFSLPCFHAMSERQRFRLRGGLRQCQSFGDDARYGQHFGHAE